MKFGGKEGDAGDVTLLAVEARGAFNAGRVQRHVAVEPAWQPTLCHLPHPPRI